jgi:hypothetical protein
VAELKRDPSAFLMDAADRLFQPRDHVIIIDSRLMSFCAPGRVDADMTPDDQPHLSPGEPSKPVDDVIGDLPVFGCHVVFTGGMDESILDADITEFLLCE